MDYRPKRPRRASPPGDHIGGSPRGGTDSISGASNPAREVVSRPHVSTDLGDATTEATPSTAATAGEATAVL